MDSKTNTYLLIIAMGMWGFLTSVMNYATAELYMYSNDLFAKFLMTFVSFTVNVVYFALFYRFFFANLVRGGQ